MLANMVVIYKDSEFVEVCTKNLQTTSQSGNCPEKVAVVQLRKVPDEFFKLRSGLEE